MDIVFRAILIFVFLLFLTRIVGRRELSSLEPFDLILLIVIGDLVQQGVTQSDHSVTGAILAAGTFAVLTVVVSYLSFRVARLRPVIEGEPMVLMQDGQPIERNLRRERITIGELAAAARKNGISTLDQVQWAVLETSGQVSFLQKS
jgi:uncharacterized membrane protein YcaP (DUF421 family)